MIEVSKPVTKMMAGTNLAAVEGSEARLDYALIQIRIFASLWALYSLEAAPDTQRNVERCFSGIVAMLRSLPSFQPTPSDSELIAHAGQEPGPGGKYHFTHDDLLQYARTILALDGRK